MSRDTTEAAIAAAAEALAPELLAWWDTHGRKDLPWQQGVTPYRVWVSEIMLQQTQVATVERYFDRFVTSFPDVAALAAATEDAVLHHWSGLGYYSRARNLHKAARVVCAEHGGEIPDDMPALLALPGIGRSTAGAILALARDRRYAILDGNAKRVLARYFAVAGWSGAAANLKQLWAYAEACIPQARVANYTQAIMDLGATLCRRGRPDCGRCPLASRCRALALGTVADIPAPKPRKARPRRSAVLLMVRSEAAVLLEKRPASGIWGGLWSFPEFPDRAAAETWCATQLGSAAKVVAEWAEVEHAFSHFDFAMRPLEVRLDKVGDGVADDDRWRWYDISAPDPVGLAAPVSKLLQRLA